MSSLVRVTDETRETLRHLAEETHEPMQHILAKAVETYRRQRILDRTNAAYAALRADLRAWREIVDEREGWDAALADGLEDDEYPLDQNPADE